MSRIFSIEKDYYSTGEVIFKKSRVTIAPGLTVLVGCNGSGKTTFLKMIESRLRRDKIDFVKYDNLMDGGTTALDRHLLRYEMESAAFLFTSSEGEKIRFNIATFAGQIARTAAKAEKEGKKEFWILMDSTDSGLSIDNVVELKKDLFQTVYEDCRGKGIEVYILISANEYELARGENSFDVYEGKYRRFKSYEAYRKFILKSREEKDKREEVWREKEEKKKEEEEEERKKEEIIVEEDEE